MRREEGLPLDPACDRCDAPLVDARLGVVRDGQNYCCANCARADAADIRVREGAQGGAACSRCGAPIHDRASAVTEGTHVFCCANCSAAGVNAEPLPEA
jgi:hypothetical protein